VREWTLIGEAGDTRRYQAVPALNLEAQLGDHIDDLCEDGWRQTGWFADRDAFSMFSSFWQEHADFGLERLTRDGEPESPGDGLTDRQYEALRTAYELGYFDIPRRASLDDVAEELDITASSVSERLRRAQTQLIQETVATTWPPLPN
jgi:predicted DNA binding protein